MPQSSRETIATELFNLLAGAYAWNTSSRRWRMWTEIPGASQPALFLVPQPEEVEYRGRGVPRIYTLKFLAIVYCNTGNDPAAVPATLLNAALDAIDAVLPSGGKVQTLGLQGISEVRIRGEIKTDEGNLGPQAFALIPIEVVTT